MATHDGIVVIGAGGHARVILSTLRASRQRIAGVYDDAPTMWGTKLMGFEIQGPIDKVRDYPGPAVVGVGSPSLRQTIVERLSLSWVSVIHPHSFVHPTVSIGDGSVIFAGSVIQAEAEIGEHAIINTGACVDHNCIVGPYAQVAPNATLCGNVSVETGTFIGAGAVVLENLSVGEWTIVGAGATVIGSLAPFVTAVGCPARIVKRRSGPPSGQER